MKQTDAACTQREVVITQSDLPLSCPSDHQKVWNAHPRVFLSLGEDGKVTCPYCSTRYCLEGSVEV